MRYVEVGGVRVSAIGLGTWQFGSKDWGYGDQYATGEAERITHRALELGVNLIDTAEIYGRGASEQIVGRAIAGRRDEVFVATKVLPVWPTASIVDGHGRRSAQRLGIDHIDLYQIHWPNPIVAIGAQMSGMRRLLATDTIGHVGVSNFSLNRWQAAERALGSPVLSNQVQFSLAVPKPRRSLLPWAQANDRIVIAYSPLAKGLLSGRYDAGNLPTNSARAFDPLFLPENVSRAQELIETLRTIAARHDATPSQIALAWLVQQPNVVAIPGASSVAQLEANVAAADIELSADDMAELTAASDRFTPLAAAKAWPRVARHAVGRRR
jgi:aryl-alcohol dehydrogenase-like predicted oxidoreductase